MVYFNATEMGMQDRAEQYLTIIQNNAKRKRCQELQINEAQLNPIIPSYVNVASDKEMIGKLAGGILPYIFIAFGFIGCMYPAIDLFTGEKERGTIETLLTTPVKRWQILFGKMGEALLLNGQKVLPKRLLESGFKFGCKNLEVALEKY